MSGHALKRESMTWLQIAAGGLVLVGVLLAFWFVALVGEQAIRPANMTARTSVDYVPVDSQGTAIKPERRYRAPYFNDPVYRSTVEEGGSRVAFLIPFTSSQPEQELAFFLAATPGLQEIRLNGQVIQPNVPLDTLRGAAEGKTLYYMLPASLVRQGENEIQVLIESQSSILVLAPFHIGPATEAAQATSMANLIANIVPIIAISVLIFASLLCMVTNWPLADRDRMRSLVLLMAIWAGRTYFITFQLPFQVPFLVTSFVYYIFEFSLIIAFARHLLVGETVASKWIRRLGWLWLILLAYLVVLTIAGFLMGPVVRDGFKALAIVISGMGLVILVAGLAALAWGIATRRDGRWLERISLMFCLVALAVDSADSAFSLTVPFRPDLPLTFYLAAPFGLLLGLGIVASIAREASEARRTVVQSNEILASRLEEQDAELARQYQAQKQMLQRQVMLEERQRIVRDMHDGIGGQLLGLMMQVRGGGTEPKVIEEGLQSSIADLRLIVDSMDTADEGLAQTLRSFEHRVRAQVEAAGIAFAAEHGLGEDQPGPGPRPTLQILRIIQEAVTNAMRHSGAKQITLASRLGEGGQIEISVSDNGRGMPDEIKGGRGLTSMRSRAEAVGGTLAFDSGGEGTGVHLTFPAP